MNPCPPYPYWNSNAANRCHPYGNSVPLVDKLIGPDAFDVVYYVAQHMPAIQRAALLANKYQKRLETLMSVAGGGAAIVMPLGIGLSNIVSSSVLVRTVDGRLLGSDSGLFSSVVTSAGLMVTLAGPTPDPTLDAAVVRWFLTFEGQTSA